MKPDAWVKSSQCDTSACVEVTWRKSSLSTLTESCVEVGWRRVDRPAAEVKGQTDEA